MEDRPKQVLVLVRNGQKHYLQLQGAGTYLFKRGEYDTHKIFNSITCSSLRLHKCVYKPICFFYEKKNYEGRHKQ
jgi:hypothetical protein